MKKIIISLFISLFVILSCTALTFAFNNIIETPDVKVVIDGKFTSYKDVPVVVNDRTMLPLREILTNLGVPNDDEHISWNDSEQSVSINKGGKKIYLKVNSNEAKVDGVSTTLEVAPISYKDRVYIPVRFVSQVLDKKVVWDGSTTTVLIRDLNEYNKIEEILKKSDAAMKAANKVGFKLDMGMKMSQNDFAMNFNADMSGKQDQKNKLMYLEMKMNLLGMDMKTESYYINNTEYSKNPFTGEWEKKALSKIEYDKTFNENSSMDVFENSEALSCGLVQSETSGTNEIILKGNVFLDELYNKANQKAADKNEFKVDTFYMEAYLDKTTYRVNKVIMKLEGKSEDEQNSSASFDVSLEFTDYDGNFEIKVPDDVIKNAVDSKTGSSLKFD